jgi:hypothetical protein
MAASVSLVPARPPEPDAGTDAPPDVLAPADVMTAPDASPDLASDRSPPPPPPPDAGPDATPAPPDAAAPEDGAGADTATGSDAPADEGAMDQGTVDPGSDAAAPDPDAAVLVGTEKYQVGCACHVGGRGETGGSGLLAALASCLAALVILVRRRRP